LQQLHLQVFVLNLQPPLNVVGLQLTIGLNSLLSHSIEPFVLDITTKNIHFYDKNANDESKIIIEDYFL